MKRTLADKMEFVERAADFMRENPTLAEAAMWKILEPLGFKRQWEFMTKTKNGLYSLYVLDFFLPELKLCVEVDGGVHKRTKGRDRRRDTRLAGEGIRTLRFSNQHVMVDPRGVEYDIKKEMEHRG